MARSSQYSSSSVVVGIMLSDDIACQAYLFRLLLLINYFGPERDSYGLFPVGGMSVPVTFFEESKLHII